MAQESRGEKPTGQLAALELLGDLFDGAWKGAAVTAQALAALALLAGTIWWHVLPTFLQRKASAPGQDLWFVATTRHGDHAVAVVPRGRARG